MELAGLEMLTCGSLVINSSLNRKVHYLQYSTPPFIRLRYVSRPPLKHISLHSAFNFLSCISPSCRCLIIFPWAYKYPASSTNLPFVCQVELRHECIISTKPQVFCLLHTAYCLLPRTNSLLGIAHSQRPTAYCLLPAAHSLLLPTAHYLLAATHCLLAATHCLLDVAYCLLPAAHCLVLTAHCLLRTIYCLLFPAYRPLPTAHCQPHCLLGNACLPLATAC
jgi:hypothetical protein